MLGQKNKADYVRELYKELLGRDVSQDELDQYISFRVSAFDCFYRVIQSDEYRARIQELEQEKQAYHTLRGHTLTVSEAEEIYRKILNRGLDTEERERIENSDISSTELLRDIAGSTELEERLKKLVNESEAFYALRGKTVSILEAEEIYRKLLGRELSEEEQTRFESMDIGRTELLRDIAESNELEERLNNRAKERDDLDNSIELKSSLMDLLLGRPIRDYEIELFHDQEIGDFIRGILLSDERKQHVEKTIKEDVIEPKYGATTYKIKWKRPTTFTCVYNAGFIDVITEEIRKEREGIWKDQYELLRFFPEHGVFLDLGANIGVISCMIESKGWYGYAIEASYKNAECIRRAIRINDLNIEVGEFAVSDKTETLHFLENGPWGLIESGAYQQDDALHSKAFEKLSYIDVPAFALDDWNMTGFSTPNEVTYIKIDIEGAEIAAINGMRKFLNRYGYPPIFCESNGESQYYFGHTTEDLRAVLSELGYHRYSWRNNRLIPCDEKRFQSSYCVDYLFLREVPKYLESFLSDAEQENKENVKSRILEMLYDGIFGEKIHVCSELKCFPEYLEDKDICEAVKLIRKAGNKTLVDALSWFQNIEHGLNKEMNDNG